MAELKLLKSIYAEAFGDNNHSFFKRCINLAVGSWMKDLSSLIDKKCRQNVIYEIKDSDKIIAVLRYLTSKNDIKMYEKFITIWKKHDPAKADLFEGNLSTSIENAANTAEESEGKQT